MVLVTNAARTEGPIRAMLDSLSVPRDVYDALVTSGDVTRSLVAARAGGIIHHVGPATDNRSSKGST